MVDVDLSLGLVIQALLAGMSRVHMLEIRVVVSGLLPVLPVYMDLRLVDMDPLLVELTLAELTL